MVRLTIKSSNTHWQLHHGMQASQSFLLQESGMPLSLCGIAHTPSCTEVALTSSNRPAGPLRMAASLVLRYPPVRSNLSIQVNHAVLARASSLMLVLDTWTPRVYHTPMRPIRMSAPNEKLHVGDAAFSMVRHATSVRSPRPLYIPYMPLCVYNGSIAVPTPSAILSLRPQSIRFLRRCSSPPLSFLQPSPFSFSSRQPRSRRDPAMRFPFL